MLPFRNKNSYLAYSVAGGMATASNVFVFQLFASVPSDVLAMSAILLVGLASFISGVLLAGVLGRVLLDSLRRAGVVKDQPESEMGRWVYPAFLVCVSVLTVIGGIYLHSTLQGPPTVHIGGQVSEPYDYSYSDEDEDLLVTILETAKPGLMGTYTGVPLLEIISRAQPVEDATSVLARATDGYDFFIQMSELEENDQVILAQSGGGSEMTYSVAGAKNSKAWVRNVAEILVVGHVEIEITGALESAHPYDPDHWQFDMDNARLDLGYGVRKYQGVALGLVLQSMLPQPQASKVTLRSRRGEEQSMDLSQVLQDTSIRVWNVTAEEGIVFAVASEGGHIWLTDVVEIEVS